MAADADCAEASLIDALQSCNHQGLYDRFSSFLLPFGELIPLPSHKLKPTACRKGTAITTATKKRGPTKKNPEPNTLPLRPLAKRFLPFLCRALKLLPALLRKNHKSPNTGVDDRSAAELLQVYALLIDCLACISPCLAGKPYSVHLQRGELVVSLEAWGKYEEAEVEALKLLESLSLILVEAAPISKSCKNKIVTAGCYLPDPAIVGADDVEITTLVIEVVVVLTRCAYKRKVRNEGTYTRILDLIDQIQPWLRFLDPESLQKYLSLLVSTLCKCSLFLLEEYIYFEGDMVQRFCLKMLTECARSSSIDHFQGMARKIISSVDLQWATGSLLLLGILRLTLESILYSCKVNLLKPADDFLETVSYFASRICVGNADFCIRASELLYQHSYTVLQASLPVASILALYATGLYFELGNFDANQSVGLHNSYDAYTIKLFDDNGVDLQKLSILLDKTTSGFHFANHLNEMNFCSAMKDSRDELNDISKSGKAVTCMQTHGRVSLVSYIDAFEFLRKPIVEFVNTTWKNFCQAKEHALHSVSLNYAQKVLHELCDLMLAASSSSDMSEKVERRLIESQGTLLEFAIAAFKISLITDENYQKSMHVINCIISSSLLEPQKLKFLISAINNVGAVCHNSGWLEKATKTLQMCIEIIWAYIELICSNHSVQSKQVDGNNTSEDRYKDAIDDAFSRIATIIDFLYKRGATNIKEIVVKSFYKFFVAEGNFDNTTGFMTLMKQWVKIICKEFKDADAVDNVPVLYFLLLDSCSTLSMEITSKILEQELTVYELMESRNPNLCQNMQLKVMDLLLNDVYTSTDYNLQRSRILIRKGRILRAHGTHDLNNCLGCLLEAISLLRCISGESSQGSVAVAHQLALVYILYAQCSQEANQDCNVILHNIQCALNIWSGMNVQSYFINNHNEWKPANALPLLCSILDMLSLKGCLKFQIEICKLIIRFYMLENESLEKCISLLWTNGRLNHSLCSSPINENLISWISEQFGLNINSLDYWISCMKDHPPYQCMLLQKLIPTNSVFPTSHYSVKSSYAQISIEEVKSVASSLISEVPLTSKSALVAAYLYHDLSERLISNGRFFEALPYSREALSLRTKILRRKFIYTVAEDSLEAKHDKVTKSKNFHICLEAVSNSITERWLNLTCNLDDSIFSSWSVLRCYLESTLQVGTICESTGNGIEAEYLFRIGKEISCLHGLSVLSIAFTLLLGQLYRRKQLWDLADNEFKYAKKLLMDYDSIISCGHCKTAFEVSIDMHVADLTMNLFGKGIQTKCNASLSHALNLYKLALEKVELASVGSSIDISQYPKAHSNKADINGVQGTSKLCSSVCCICLSLNGHMNFADGKLLPIQIKKTSTKSLECLETTKDINHKPKLRRKRPTGRSADSFPTSRKSNCVNQEEKLSSEKYSCELPNELSGTFEAGCGGKEDSRINKIECLRCLIFQVVENGFMNDILYLKRERYHRTLVLMLLLKIAKCLGIHCGKHVEHEVHEVFGRCTSVIFNWKFLACSGMPDLQLIHLIVDERLGDFFRMERAAVLYYMSWFCLKNISEHPRTCCSLSKIHMTIVFPWLLQAFILCQQSPMLCQKVSRLLSSIFLLSSLDSSVSLPVKIEEPLSINHWAAYFHQASVGAQLHCQYYYSTKDIKVFSNSSIPSDTANRSNFFRFSLEKLEDLEEHVLEFFKILPSIPIICVSMLGGDYANLIGEMLLLPSFFPAWILLCRLVANNQPIVILLPVNLIPEEILCEDDISGQRIGDSDAGPVKQWSCPWGYSVINCVLPSFKQLLEENFLLLSNATFAPADIKTKIASWWSQRTMLNNFLSKLLRTMEISWLGPWGCLLLGERLGTQNGDTMIHKLIGAMKSQGKCKISYSLIKAIICGANSVADAESCIQQSLLYESYFGHGECCGKESFRAFSVDPQEVLEIHDIIKESLMEFAEPVDREPVILVLDSDIQMLPWENLPILRSQEIYRMPSVSSIFITLDRSCSHHRRDKAFGTIIPAIDPLNTYYLLNPSGDLNDTQVEFEEWFRNQEWEGKAGKIPTTEELILALQSRDLFLYFGHGSGTQYIPEKQIQKMDHCAATLLMGCSSGSLIHRGRYAPQGAPLSYLFAGSPAVIANLWDVTDKDIDRFAKALLTSWLLKELDPLDNCTRDNQLVKRFGCISMKNEMTLISAETRRKVHIRKSHNLFDGGQCRKRDMVASFIGQARGSCKLPMLIGASPVCYGVPTVIRNKSES